MPRDGVSGARVVVAAVVVAAVSGGVLAGGDYLGPEQRARVEWLKREVAAGPTTLDTMAERADVLWEWANAYAMAGGVIPNDLPLVVRASREAKGPNAESVVPYLDGVDHFTRELQVKDEVPGALGTLELDRTQPLVAESWTTVVQTWTVGEVPMVEGGAIYLGRDGFNNHGTPQVTHPAGDNYLAITSSNPDAYFVSEGEGDRQTLVTAILGIFRLEGAALHEGDTVTLTYGDRSRGSRGFKVQSYSVSRCTFPVYLDLEGTGYFMQPAWPGVEVVGKRDVYAVEALAPSIVAAGEPFDLTVRWEDDRYNRISGTVPKHEVLLDGSHLATTPAGSSPLAVVEDLVITTPGVHRFTVRSTDGSVAGTSNPVWVLADPAYRILWGDTHGHVAFADGQGTPDGYYRYARDDARLDFATLSEHTLWTDDREWRTLQEMVAAYGEVGRFVPILGHEWTVALPEGHHNVYYRDPSSGRVGSQVVWLLPDLYRAIRRRLDPDDVLVVPHAHNPGNWRVTDPDLERLVEITSTHGTFEWFGNRYLAEGWEVGFIGSSDNHHEHPGLTDAGPTGHHQRGGLAAVYVSEHTGDAIFSALRDRRTYATGGKRIILDATFDGAPVGSRLPYGAERRLSCRVMGTAPIDTVDVVKNGDVVYQRRYIAHSLEPHSWVRVGFASSSEVQRYDTPRGLRVWNGTLEIAGARLLQVIAPGLENRYYEGAEIADDNLVEFLVITRGRMDAIGLELEDAGPETTIRIRVDPGSSGHGGVTTETIDTTLVLEEAAHEPVVQEYQVVDPGTGRPSVDTLSVEIFALSDSLDQDLAYTDLGPAEPGDYYYLRVTQIDGERAWSSPWWVGGEPRSPWLRSPRARRAP